MTNSGQSKKRYALVFLLLILLIATILRLLNLSSLSFSNDELSALFRVHYNSFDELIVKGVQPDYHPAGIQIFIYYWTKAFGTSEFAVKLPFVLFSLLSIFLIYIIGSRWFGKMSGLLSAAAAGFLHFPLLYSQLARPYASGLCFVLLTVLLWDIVLFRMNHRKTAVKILFSLLLGIAFSLAIYNHYFSFMMAGIIGLTGLFLMNRNTAPWYLLSAIIATILFIPHIQVTLTQLSYKGLSTWLAIPDRLFAIQHLGYLFNNSWLVIIASIVVAIFSFLTKKGKKKNTFSLILLIWFLTPMIIGYFYSVYVNPILQHSVLLFSFPFLILLLFSYSKDSIDAKECLLLTGFSLIMLFSTIVERNYYGTKHFSDFKSAGKTICQWQNSTTPIYAVTNNPWYLKYYTNQYCKGIAIEDLGITRLDQIPALRNKLKHNKNKQVVYSKNRPSPPHIPAVIQTHYPYLTGFKNLGFLEGCWRFSKLPSEKNISNNLPDTTVIAEHTFASCQNDADEQKMNNKGEFIQLADIDIDWLQPSEYDILYCIVDVYFPDSIKEAQLVFSSIKKNKETGIWNSAPAKYFVDKGIEGRWIHAMEYLNIIKDHAQLKIYIWNPANEQYFLKHYRIYTVHYNEN